MPWVGEEGLARCWDDELWPPQVFAMIGMNEVSGGENFTGKSSGNEEIDFRRGVGGGWVGGWWWCGSSIYRGWMNVTTGFEETRS